MISLSFIHSDAAEASFSDDRCDADGVCPSDPLTFTCEINEIPILQVVLPNGEVEFVSPGISQDKLNEELPDGFTAEDLVITPIDNASRNYVLTLSIASASLLDGGVITCDGATGSSANAGCPILGKNCKLLCFQERPICSLYMDTRPHVSVHRNVYCIQEYQSMKNVLLDIFVVYTPNNLPSYSLTHPIQPETATELQHSYHCHYHMGQC